MSKAGIKQVREMGITLASITRIYPSRIDTLRLLVEVLRGSTYDGNTRSGISDPTPSAAEQVGPWLYLDGQIDDDLLMAKHHLDMAYQKLNRVPSDLNTAELATKHRCSVSGAEALESWARPECTNVIGEGSTTMLCDACRQRKAEHRRKQARIEGAA